MPTRRTPSTESTTTKSEATITPAVDVSLFDQVKITRGRKHQENEWDALVADFMVNPRIMAIPSEDGMDTKSLQKAKNGIIAAAKRVNMKANFRLVTKPAPEALSAFEGKTIFVLKPLA